MPVRLQRKRTKGYRLPPDAVYVGRPSRWGNPYKVVSVRGDIGVARETPDGYSWVIYGTSLASAHYWAAKAYLWVVRFRDLPAIRGKDLVCWCRLCPVHQDGKPLGVGCLDCEPCHADEILAVANR